MVRVTIHFEILSVCPTCAEMKKRLRTFIKKMYDLSCCSVEVKGLVVLIFTSLVLCIFVKFNSARNVLLRVNSRMTHHRHMLFTRRDAGHQVAWPHCPRSCHVTRNLQLPPSHGRKLAEQTHLFSVPRFTVFQIPHAVTPLKEVIQSNTLLMFARNSRMKLTV